MIFGKTKDFAIECVVNARSKDARYTFGHILLWIAREELGQSDLRVVLEVPVFNFERSLDECGTRKMDLFSEMNAMETHHFLESVLWGKPEETKSTADIMKEDKQYSRFNICINFSESFDGESLYLIEEPSNERYIWKKFGSEKISEARLESGTYKKVINSFLSWFESESS